MVSYLKVKLFSNKGALIFGIFFLLVFSPTHLLKKATYDDASYVAHAFTIGLDGDLNYSNEPVDRLYAKKIMPPHPIGSGFLAAPFVALFSVLDRISGHPVIVNHDNYLGSWSLFGIVFAVNIMFFAGIYFYLKSFKLLDLLKNELWLIILFIFSSTIPYFVLNRYLFSHGFEFFAVALLFLCIIKIYNKVRLGESFKFYVYIYMLLFSINLFIRYSNINLILLSPITFLIIYLFIDNGKSEMVKNKMNRLLYLLPLVSLISILPNLIFFYVNYGSYIPKPSLIYDKPYWLESYSFVEVISILIKRVPYILNINLGSEMGLIYTNPIIPLGFISVITLLVMTNDKRRDNYFYKTLLLGLILLFFGFGFSIHLWWQGMASSYGYRYLLQTFPIGLFGVIITYNFINDNRKKVFKYYKGALLLLSTISLFSLVFFKSTENLKLTEKLNAFNVEKAYSGNGYMSDLPGEIIKPYTWVRLVGKSTFGYIISPAVVQNMDIKPLVKLVYPNENPEQLDIDIQKYMDRSQLLGTGMIFQILILLFLWSLFGYWLSTYQKVVSNE